MNFLKFMNESNYRLKLSIVIPVYNEERTLQKLINSVEAVDLPLEKEIILIDDASTDGTREILKTMGERYKIIFQNKNQGKGAAIKKGFQEATGDVVLIQDADLEYSPQDYLTLIKPIVDGVTDVVYGSRFFSRILASGSSEPAEQNKVVYWQGYLFSQALNWMSNVLSGVWLSDMYTCYKVFSRNAINQIYPHLKSKRFGIDPELTAWVGKMGFKVVEVPISYRGRTYREGKKINWKDGLAAIFHIIRFNLFTHK